MKRGFTTSKFFTGVFQEFISKFQIDYIAYFFTNNTVFGERLFVLNLYQRGDNQNLGLDRYEANKLRISRMRNLGPPQMNSC